ncbi:MAG TPA: AAA family ATPase, partial [Acidimicrobiales bacterium]
MAGTGTEVGKTWVASGLARRLQSAGLTVAARKPAQSDSPGTDEEETDAGRLAAATGATPGEVCPRHRWYPLAMAPPMAADALGREPVRVADLAAETTWPPSVEVGLVET